MTRRSAPSAATTSAGGLPPMPPAEVPDPPAPVRPGGPPGAGVLAAYGELRRREAAALLERLPKDPADVIRNRRLVLGRAVAETKLDRTLPRRGKRVAAAAPARRPRIEYVVVEGPCRHDDFARLPDGLAPEAD